jgi:DNA (cytosine-5)-methyltransferase 1
MDSILLLTGGMFGLGVHRPRLFECSHLIFAPQKAPPPPGCIGVYGERPDGRRLSNNTKQRAASSVEAARLAMGIDWMEWRELCESIPPAYTEWIGKQLIDAL